MFDFFPPTNGLQPTVRRLTPPPPPPFLEIRRVKTKISLILDKTLHHICLHSFIITLHNKRKMWFEKLEPWIYVIYTYVHILHPLGILCGCSFIAIWQTSIGTFALTTVNFYYREIVYDRTSGSSYRLIPNHWNEMSFTTMKSRLSSMRKC